MAMSSASTETGHHAASASASRRSAEGTPCCWMRRLRATPTTPQLSVGISSANVPEEPAAAAPPAGAPCRDMQPAALGGRGSASSGWAAAATSSSARSEDVGCRAARMHACVHASCGAGCMSHKETLITSFSTRTQNINEKRYPPRQARVHARGLATWASTSADHRSARRSLPTRPAEDQAGHAPAARRRQHLASSRGITRRVRRVELHCVHALNYRAGSAARVQPQLGSRGRAA